MNVEQEPENVRGGFVLIVVTATMATALAAVLCSTLILRARSGHVRPSDVTPPLRTEVAGIAQTAIDGPARGALKRQSEARVLQSYAYLDQDHRTARIPIARAMQWFVEDAQRGPIPSPDPGTVLGNELPDRGSRALGGSR